MITDINKNGSLIKDEQAIINEIDNLFSIRVGELAFNREFGTYLEDYLFEEFTFRILTAIKMEIRRAINRWIKNVTIENIEVNYDELNGVLNILINLIYNNKKVVYEKTIGVK